MGRVIVTHEEMLRIPICEDYMPTVFEKFNKSRECIE
jgi:hypothetical protein